jgi:hypothetical protein
VQVDFSTWQAEILTIVILLLFFKSMFMCWQYLSNCFLLSKPEWTRGQTQENKKNGLDMYKEIRKQVTAF